LRSRFITTLAPAPDEARVVAFLGAVRDEFADATHNCYAFVVGSPGSTRQIGMSDDGEPHGTAGRPMLHTLLHSGIGDVAAVVTRYYGGTKLGKGGLGRAYAGGVQEALQSLPTMLRVARVSVVIDVLYAHLDPVKRLLEPYEAELAREIYGEGVTLEIRVPEAHLDALLQKVADVSAGRAWVREVKKDSGGVESDRGLS
jgi:uncharacterized YigZ family protein